MTKTRAPLTFELAMTQIAARIGWERVAEVAGQQERTVRNWSDPDTGPSAETMPLLTALRLDCAFRDAGGVGAPLLQCYANRLELEVAIAGADLSELSLRIATAAEEGGEAIAAAIRAALPGASEAELSRAMLEFEESIAAKQNAVAALAAILAKRRAPAEQPVAEQVTA